MRIIKWWAFFIVGCYLCGILTVLPWPLDYQWYRPLWFLMFVLFCQLSQPSLFNPFIAWVVGLIVDNLVGSRLGEHALIFSVLCYISAVLRPKFMIKPLWLHVGKIFLLVCLGQIFILWFHALAGENPHTLFYWMGTVTSCLIWPLFVILLQNLCFFLKITPTTARNM